MLANSAKHHKVLPSKVKLFGALDEEQVGRVPEESLLEELFDELEELLELLGRSARACKTQSMVSLEAMMMERRCSV